MSDKPTTEAERRETRPDSLIRSPDMLPMKGYTADQLVAYIRRQLGMPVWNVELDNQQILDCIQDALQLFSRWRPLVRPGSVQLVNGKFDYLRGVDVGLGIVQVNFVEPLPVPFEVWYGSLIDPTPMMRLGLDEYDSFLRWFKTWKRVLSVQPDWYYDEYVKALYIYNPIERYLAGVICHFPVNKLESLDFWGADWVKRYALARARYLYGEVLMKFSGAIPGPLKDLQLDTAKRDKAEVEIDKLVEELKLSQTLTPISID